MNKIHEEIKKVFESKISVGVLYIIGFIIIGLLIFSLGVSVGFRKASYGRAWGDNYERNFGMRPPRFLEGDNFPNAHGSIGKIIKIDASNIIVEDKDQTEKTILVNENTQVQKMRVGIKVSDLKVGDYIVVIGTPNENGQIEAKLIRVMPDPGSMIMNAGYRNINK